MKKFTKKEVFHNKVIIIRVNEKFKEALEIAAQKDRRTVSDFIRLSMEKVMSRRD